MAANAILMASSTKTLTPPHPATSSSPPPKHPTKLLSLLPTTKNLSLKVATLASAAMAAVAPAAVAAEIEKAALFDFDLTLPIIATEFLLLMFALDKVYYSPLGNFMDKRDAEIKEMLSGVKDTSAEVKQLEDQATAVMRAARAEISAALNKMKKETTLEVEKKIAEGRKNIEAELQEALARLAKQKEDTIKALESQIAALSEDIVKKVLPS